MLKPCVGSPDDGGDFSAHSIAQVLYSCRGEMHAGTGNLGQWLLDWVTQRSLVNLLPTSRVNFLYVLRKTVQG